VHLVSEVGAAVVLAAWTVRWWRSEPAPTVGPDAPHPALGVAAAVVVVGATIAGAARGATDGWFLEVTDAICWAGAALVGVASLWTLRKLVVRPWGTA
jgi:hypothetical protein